MISAYTGIRVGAALIATVATLAFGVPAAQAVDATTASTEQTQSQQTQSGEGATSEVSDVDASSTGTTGTDAATSAPTTGVNAPAAVQLSPAATTQETPKAESEAAAPAAQAGDNTSATDWQTQINNAKAGDEIKLSGEIPENETLTVSKKLKITADKTALVRGTIRITAEGSGTIVTGVHFVLDPAVNKTSKQNVIVSGATGVQVTSNTFDITAGNPATGASKNKDWNPNSVWLENGANGTVISDNKFTLGQVVNNSSTAVNLVGNGSKSVVNTTIENNTVTTGPTYGDGTSGSMIFVVGNGNTSADPYGIKDLKVANNTVKNGTGLSADKSKTYGVSVTATTGTVVSGNTFDGYAGVSYSNWPGQGPNDKLVVTNNTLDTYAGINLIQFDKNGKFVASYIVDKGLTVKDNVFGENTKVPVGANTSVVDQDGTAYASIVDAINAGATTVTLLQDVTEDVTIPDGKSVTLDLNGYTLTNKTNDTDTITNNGTLTVTDSSAKATGKVTGNFANNGTATIAGGTVTGTVTAAAGKLSITGGVFQGAITVKDGAAATIAITGGTFATEPDKAYIAAGYEVVKNADGTFTVKETAPTKPEQPNKPTTKPAATTKPTTSPKALSKTGASVLAVAGVAIALVVIAGGATLLNRRRD